MISKNGIKSWLIKQNAQFSSILLQKAIYKETSADAESQRNNNNLKCESTITNINSIEVSWELSSKKKTRREGDEERREKKQRSCKKVSIKNKLHIR